MIFPQVFNDYNLFRELRILSAVMACYNPSEKKPQTNERTNSDKNKFYAVYNLVFGRDQKV